MDADPDVELMLAVKRGDQRAFAQLFDRYSRSVVQFAYRFVGDRARAEELAQDVFMKLYRSAGSYEANARFKTFLFRITANHCMNERRRGEYKAPHQSKDAPPPGSDAPSGPELESTDNSGPEQALLGRRLEAALAQALDGLSPRERAAFSMARFISSTFCFSASICRFSSWIFSFSRP